MYCRHCGYKLPNGAESCPNCGCPAGGENAAGKDESAGKIPADASDPDKVLTAEEKEKILRNVREERAEAERIAAEKRQAEEKRRQEEEDAKHRPESARKAEPEEKPQELPSDGDSFSEQLQQADQMLSPEEQERIRKQAREELAERERLKAERRQAEEHEKEEARRQKERVQGRVEFETEQKLAQARQAAEERRRQSERNADSSSHGEASGNISSGIPDSGDLSRSSAQEENTWKAAPGGGQRIPYAAGPESGESSGRSEQNESRSQGDKFANASIGCSVAAIFLTVFPYAGIPLGLMGLIFGILALHNRTARNGRAVCGILIGIGTILLGAVLMIAIGALMPYEDQLIRMFQQYINSAH